MQHFWSPNSAMKCRALEKNCNVSASFPANAERRLNRSTYFPLLSSPPNSDALALLTGTSHDKRNRVLLNSIQISTFALVTRCQLAPVIAVSVRSTSPFYILWLKYCLKPIPCVWCEKYANLYFY